MKDKYQKLKQILSPMDNLLVAYSGGVDSTLLLKVARDELGEKAVGLIVISPTLPERELDDARKIASSLDLDIIEMRSAEMDLPVFTANTDRRCYFCKDHRYQMLKEYASTEGFSTLADGSNAEDLEDYRPGHQAAQEHAVRSPLQEARFSKQDIRNLAKQLGLPNWDKPSSACLASRIPYGTEITLQRLTQIEAAENLLFDLGLTEFRVRHHGDIARIETKPDDFDKVIKHGQKISSTLRDLGFLYITLDMDGFRSGSLNEGRKSDG
jgi:uncharacterized protein